MLSILHFDHPLVHFLALVHLPIKLLLQLLCFLCLAQFTLQATHLLQSNGKPPNFIYFVWVLVVVVHQGFAEGTAQMFIVLEIIALITVL